MFNLAFGDINIDNEIDDEIVSNNGDRNKILATIVNVVDDYTNKYPDRWIIFSGSTKERSRLYRMAIGIHLEELSTRFNILALNQGQLTPFQKNIPTDAFFN